MVHLTLLITALIAVESGGDDTVIGRHGERGALQITPTVWQQHTKLPFYKAHSRIYSVRVGERHLCWLVKNGVADNPWCLAYAWNAGLVGYKRANRLPAARFSKASKDYADRVLAVYTYRATVQKR